jgi:hypothetical protein
MGDPGSIAELFTDAAAGIAMVAAASNANVGFMVVEWKLV